MPIQDCQYLKLPYRHTEIEHQYGNRVHLLADPYLSTLLARLSSEETGQPDINHLIEVLYSHLLKYAMNGLFPRKQKTVVTRMAEHHPKEGAYEAELLDDGTNIVIVDLVRAGILPSHTCYTILNETFNPNRVRQDHIYAARVVNDKGEVTGTHFSGSKVGGSVDGAFVLFPDPMGATGSTLVEAMKFYKNEVGGKARRMIALHLIVTPEYLKNVLKENEDLEVFAIRLDRGLSKDTLFKSPPGLRWDEEVGLNANDYIVPGAGGLGEIMNNVFV